MKIVKSKGGRGPGPMDMGVGKEDGDDEGSAADRWMLEITERLKAQGAGRKVAVFCHLIALC